MILKGVRPISTTAIRGFNFQGIYMVVNAKAMFNLFYLFDIWRELGANKKIKKKWHLDISNVIGLLGQVFRLFGFLGMSVYWLVRNLLILEGRISKFSYFLCHLIIYIPCGVFFSFTHYVPVWHCCDLYKKCCKLYCRKKLLQL